MKMSDLIMAARRVTVAAQGASLPPDLAGAIDLLGKLIAPRPSMLAALDSHGADRNAAARPKREYVRSQALREAYRQIPCQHCGRDDGTVCCAHSNWSIHGKGGAIKADDSRGASLCAQCHVPILDQGSKLSKEERQRMWWDAHVKTVRELRRRGLWPKHIAVPDISGYPF